ncbi:MAG: PHP domain-containing protein, partial [Chryseobacterium sp.]|nr:PHP domain-containing protein [Chryseobacterium sp.]
MYLNCHTFHSLRYGTISIENLVQQAVENNIKTLALTDINTITGIYDFTKLCHQNEIKPVVGVEIRSENELYYITLAKNAKGIAEINRMLTAHNCKGKILPKTNPDFKEVFVVYPLENIPETLLDNEFIGVKAEQLNLIFNSML